MEITSPRGLKANELDTEDLFTYKSGNILKTICSNNSIVFYQQDNLSKQRRSDVSGNTVKRRNKKTSKDTEAIYSTSLGLYCMNVDKGDSSSCTSARQPPENQVRYLAYRNSSMPRPNAKPKRQRIINNNFGVLPSISNSPKLRNHATQQTSIEKDKKDGVTRKDYKNIHHNSKVLLLLTDSDGQCLLAAATKRKKKNKLDINTHSERIHIDSNSIEDKKISNKTNNSHLSEYDAIIMNTVEVSGKNKKRSGAIVAKENYNSTLNVSTQTVQKKRKVGLNTAVEQLRRPKETIFSTNSFQSDYHCNDTKPDVLDPKEGNIESCNLAPITSSCRNKINYTTMRQNLGHKNCYTIQSQDKRTATKVENIVKRKNDLKDIDMNSDIFSGKNVNNESLKIDKHEQDLKERLSSPNINIKIDGSKEFYDVSINYSKSGHEEIEIKAVINRIMETEKLKNDMFKDIQLVKCVAQNLRSTDKTQLKPDIMIPERKYSENENTEDEDNVNSSSTDVGNANLAPFSFGDAGDMSYSKNIKLKTAQPNIRKSNHFRGDACYFQNPFERDREIQRLLGIQRQYSPSMSKPPRSWPSKMKGSEKNNHANMKCETSSKRIPAEEIKEKKPNNKSITLQCHLCCNTITEEKQISENNKMQPIYWFVPKEGVPINMQKIAKEDVSGVCDHKPITIDDNEYKLLKQFVSEKLKNETDQHVIRKKSSTSIRKWKMTRQKVDFKLIQSDFESSNRAIEKVTIQGQTSVVHSKSCQMIKALSSRNLRKSLSSSLCNVGRSNGVICNTDCAVFSVCKVNRSLKSRCEKSESRPSNSKQTKSSKKVINSSKDEARKFKLAADAKICESAKVCENSSSLQSYNCSPSLCTLFKVQSKNTSLTPNLGSSSLGDGTSVQSNSKIEKYDAKPKSFFEKIAWFLRNKKLTNGTGTSLNTFDIGDTIITVPALVSAQTSVNSYFINSGLGEVEMSSSIYDTSASQYSDHTTRQLNKPRRKKTFARRMMQCLPCVSADTDFYCKR